MNRAAAVMALLAAAIACGDTPEAGYLLKRQRVLGATRAVVGDENRTTPTPGETIAVEWLLDAPRAVEPTTWIFVVCPPSAQQFGIPICGGPPLELILEATPQEAQPRFEFTVPADYAADELVVLGAICMGGVVDTTLNPNSSTTDLQACRSGEGTGEVVSTTLTVEQRPTQRNQKPAFASLMLESQELTEEVPLAREPCRGGTLPQVALDQEAALLLRVTPESREPYIRELGEQRQERVEDLQNSLFVTEGTLNRRFTFVDDDTPEPTFEFLAEANPDDPLPAEGRTVKMIVVMRDRRGGEAILRRGFCLLP